MMIPVSYLLIVLSVRMVRRLLRSEDILFNEF